MPGKRVVADASVVVKWVIPERYSDEASRLRDDHLSGNVVVHAPDLVLLEVASALRKYAAKGLISRDQAEEALLLVSSAEIRLEHIDSELARRALELSLDLGVTVYDAAYIATALRLTAPLYTSDEELLSNSKVRGLGIVRHIRDYRHA